MNASARPICNLRRHDSVIDVLVSLQWPRLEERIKFKIGVLAYKVPHRTAPTYLDPLVRV